MYRFDTSCRHCKQSRGLWTTPDKPGLCHLRRSARPGKLLRQRPICVNRMTPRVALQERRVMADIHGKHARPEIGAEGALARLALRFTAFTEKWLPDAFGFVLVGTLVVLLFGLVTGEPLLKRPDSPTRPRGMAWLLPGASASGA